MKELIYVAIYKPYDVLSQFTKETENHKTLADLGLELPKDVYPVGRLDRDSEGLLLLTNDKTMNDKLLNPKFGHSRTYYAQVEGIPTAKSLELIKKGGIKIQDYQTLPADAKFITSPKLPERFPPIRLRKSIPDSWISITLTEGKNRQVRKMCASVGNPCLRLVRYSIENLSLDYLNNKMIKYMTKTEIDDLLFSVRK